MNASSESWPSKVSQSIRGFRAIQRELTFFANQHALTGAFAKVCCRVDSEDELMAIHDRAVAAGLEVHLITDSGKTEFHGVPTRTCVAIGPDEAEKIDEITGQL